MSPAFCASAGKVLAASAAVPPAIFEYDPGDVIVHDRLVLYDSGRSESAEARCAIAFGYRGTGMRLISGRNASGAKLYPSARITRVSGWTPSFFIASAAGSVCMNS